MTGNLSKRLDELEHRAAALADPELAARVNAGLEAIAAALGEEAFSELARAFAGGRIDAYLEQLTDEQRSAISVLARPWPGLSVE